MIHKSKGGTDDSVGNWDEAPLKNKNYIKKLFYGHTVKQILSVSYTFMSALVWLLKYSDLSGMNRHADKFYVLKPVEKPKEQETDI